MKCLYCGGPLTLALLKKITGAGEFCSDECRRGYQSEFNRLAVGRLQQARTNRRLTPPAELATPGVNAPELSPALAAGGRMPPISAALADVPPAPVWSQSPLPPPAPTDSALDVPNPVFLREVAAPSVPAFTAGPEAGLSTRALGSLFEAVHEESSPAATRGVVQETETEDEIWMAPRGLFPLTVTLRAVEAGLKIPHLSPAPIFVYLQLPESLIANSVGRARLASAPAAQYGARPLVPAAPVASVTRPLILGLRNQLDANHLRVAERPLPSPSGFQPECSVGLTFSWPAPAGPVVLPSLRFRPATAAVVQALQPSLAAADPRFDVYLSNDGRQELREKLRGLAERRANQRKMADSGPTVTLPLKTVEPALNLLAAFGTAILERQNRAAEQPPSVTTPAPPTSLPQEELLPKLVAGLTALQQGDRALADPAGTGSIGSGHGGLGNRGLADLAQTGYGQPGAGPVAGSTGSAGEGSVSSQQPAAFAPPAASPSPWAGQSGGAPVAPSQPPAPAYGPDGLPSGWPADVPPPAELTAPALAPARAPMPESRLDEVSPALPPLAPPPGMPGINGNVYMFGTEINAKENKDEEAPSTALAKTSSSEVEKPGSQETESSSEPNFTRPSGFPLSGGGMMNVGTMVVVNQPSGTVNINANSATASTFESRLRQKKEPTPLSSIAEAVGLQIPPPQPAKEMPLRMNFQGRLETALPVKWPELGATAMRKKMFFGGPLKPRRAGGADSLASAPQPPLPRMPVAHSPAAPEPAPEPDKAGAMGWIKSISNRFGKK